MIENSNAASGGENHDSSHRKLHSVRKSSKYKRKRRSNLQGDKPPVVQQISRHEKHANRKKEHLKKRIFLIGYIAIGFIIIAIVIAMLVNSFTNLSWEKDIIKLISILFVSSLMAIGAIVLVTHSIVKLGL